MLEQGQVPIVRVKHPDGYAVINAADFDPNVHQLYQEPVPPPRPIDISTFGGEPAALHVEESVEARRLPDLTSVSVREAWAVICSTVSKAELDAMEIIERAGQAREGIIKLINRRREGLG